MTKMTMAMIMMIATTSVIPCNGNSNGDSGNGNSDNAGPGHRPLHSGVLQGPVAAVAEVILIANCILGFQQIL